MVMVWMMLVVGIGFALFYFILSRCCQRWLHLVLRGCCRWWWWYTCLSLVLVSFYLSSRNNNYLHALRVFEMPVVTCIGVLAVPLPVIFFFAWFVPLAQKKEKEAIPSLPSISHFLFFSFFPLQLFSFSLSYHFILCTQPLLSITHTTHRTSNPLLQHTRTSHCLLHEHAQGCTVCPLLSLSCTNNRRRPHRQNTLKQYYLAARN